MGQFDKPWFSVRMVKEEDLTNSVLLPSAIYVCQLIGSFYQWVYL